MEVAGSVGGGGSGQSDGCSAAGAEGHPLRNFLGSLQLWRSRWACGPFHDFTYLETDRHRWHVFKARLLDSRPPRPRSSAHLSPFFPAQGCRRRAHFSRVFDDGGGPNRRDPSSTSAQAPDPLMWRRSHGPNRISQPLHPIVGRVGCHAVVMRPALIWPGSA